MQGSTTTQVRVCNAATPLKSWQFDHAGFLRCKTSVLRSCVLNYAPEELAVENIPAPLRNSKAIRLYVPEAELSRDRSLDSLEGRPVSVDHVWQSTLGTDDVGNIAGTPTYDPTSKMVFADILVTDPNAIRRITAETGDPKKLVEQSAGYLMEVDWTPGVTEDGEEYDGVQRDITYNHVALVGEGEGRAGKDVRILNKRSCNKMSDELVRVKFRKIQMRVHNSDVNAFEKEMSDVENLINPEVFEKMKKERDDAHSRLEAANADVEKHSGAVEQLRAKVEELQNPERVMNAAKQLVKDQEKTSVIFNSLKGKALEADIKQALDAAKDLQGAELHRHVVTAVRALNKKPALSEENASSDVYVKSSFDVLAEFSDVGEKSAVSGGEMMQSMNSKKSQESGNYNTAKQRQKLFMKRQLGKDEA